MNLKELITKMNGVKNYGLYFVDANTLKELKEPIIPNCTIQDAVKYLSYDVYEFNLGIFDENKDNKYIKACIYLYKYDYTPVQTTSEEETLEDLNSGCRCR